MVRAGRPRRERAAGEPRPQPREPKPGPGTPALSARAAPSPAAPEEGGARRAHTAPRLHWRRPRPRAPAPLRPRQIAGSPQPERGRAAAPSPSAGAAPRGAITPSSAPGPAEALCRPWPRGAVPERRGGPGERSATDAAARSLAAWRCSAARGTRPEPLGCGGRSSGPALTGAPRGGRLGPGSSTASHVRPSLRTFQRARFNSSVEMHTEDGAATATKRRFSLHTHSE